MYLQNAFVIATLSKIETIGSAIIVVLRRVTIPIKSTGLPSTVVEKGGG